jgi:hypothetical protein
LAQYAKNPGKTRVFLTERTGTEHWDVFLMFIESSKGTKEESRNLLQTLRDRHDFSINLIREQINLLERKCFATAEIRRFVRGTPEALK